MPPQQLEAAMNVAITSEIEIVEDIRDHKDQMKTLRNQLAYLLYQEADKQCAEAGKIMVNIWWRFAEADDNHDLLSEGEHHSKGCQGSIIDPKDEEDQCPHLPWLGCWLPPRRTEADGMVHPRF